MNDAVRKSQLVARLAEMEQTPEVTALMNAVRGGGYDQPDLVTIGSRSDLDGLEPTDLLNATKVEAWAALDDLAFNRTLGEVLQAAINAGFSHSQIVTNWMVVYESLDVETTEESVQAVGSPSADYLAYNAGSVAAAIGSMELIKSRMLAVDLADNVDER